MNETTTLTPTQVSPFATTAISPEGGELTTTQETQQLAIEATATTETPDGHESYERATTLKAVGLFKQAADCFEKASQDPIYALKSLAQMGLCLKKSGKQEEAVEAFRRALQIPSTSSKERVQILYLLGRTLETLDRMPEALEAYRWLRREAPQYRDVGERIELLSSRRIMKPEV